MELQASDNVLEAIAVVEEKTDISKAMRVISLPKPIDLSEPHSVTVCIRQSLLSSCSDLMTFTVPSDCNMSYLHKVVFQHCSKGDLRNKARLKGVMCTRNAFVQQYEEITNPVDEKRQRFLDLAAQLKALESDEDDDDDDGDDESKRFISRQAKVRQMYDVYGGFSSVYQYFEIDQDDVYNMATDDADYSNYDPDFDEAKSTFDGSFEDFMKQKAVGKHNVNSDSDDTKPRNYFSNSLRLPYDTFGETSVFDLIPSLEENLQLPMRTILNEKVGSGSFLYNDAFIASDRLMKYRSTLHFENRVGEIANMTIEMIEFRFTVIGRSERLPDEMYPVVKKGLKGRTSTLGEPNRK